MSEEKTQTYKIWEPLFLALVAVIGMIAGVQLSESAHGRIDAEPVNATHSKADRITEVIRFIEEKYVDNIESDVLVRNAMESILKELDPHSGYIPPEELADLNEKMEGHFDGIGIEFHMVRDTLTVLFVNPGSPAEQGGLKPMDRIITADDSLLVGLNIEDRSVLERLRGPRGSTVRLEVKRRHVDTLIPVTLSRDKITIESVFASYMPEDSTSYVRINRFSSTTYKEFMSAIEPMAESGGLGNLIIDVRQNPGGYLKEAVNILSQLFEEKGLLLVYTEGEHAKRMEYKTTGRPFYEVGNIVVLIDYGSASASEIVAGAIQDQDRGIVIGTPSYGKGLVQEQYMLKNGGALRLTTARYYTPSGRSIQTPYDNGSSVREHLLPAPDTTAYHTRYGREVYGAGGIEPDIVVENGMNWQDPRVQELYDLILDYAVYGLEITPPDDSVSLDSFLESFPDQEAVVQDIRKHYAETPVEIAWEDFMEFSDDGYLMLRCMLASHYYGRDAWFKVMNREDPVILKALETVKQDSRVTLKL